MQCETCYSALKYYKRILYSVNLFERKKTDHIFSSGIKKEILQLSTKTLIQQISFALLYTSSIFKLESCLIVT